MGPPQDEALFDLPESEINVTAVRTDNDFFIGANSAGLMPTTLPMVIRTRQQAYRTAAWIKLMGEVLPDEEPASSYEDVERAIANT